MNEAISGAGSNTNERVPHPNKYESNSKDLHKWWNVQNGKWIGCALKINQTISTRFAYISNIYTCFVYTVFFSSYSALRSDTITAILYACTIFSLLNLHFHMNVTSKHTHTIKSIRNIFFWLGFIMTESWIREHAMNLKLKQN